jgi:hypothetical protein
MTVASGSFRDWLKTAAAEPVAVKLVPGASPVERQRLGALGGIVRELVPPSERSSWPSDVIDWLAAGPSVPDGLILAMRQEIIQDPDKTLAALYGDLVSGPSRRALGTFFTPSSEVKLMLDIWESAEAAPATVVDVGAGVGVFTVSAAQRWPDAHILGVDINPVTLGLLALRIWLNSLISEKKTSVSGISLVRDDFTTWLRDSWTETASPRLVLGNPPYTRWQLLPMEDRIRLRKASNGLCGSRASLSSLMTAISLHQLDSSDGLCLLLPAQWLESQYAGPLRDYLAGLTRRRVELRLVESQPFPDAEVDAVVLLVGRERENEQPFCVATLTADNDAVSVDRADLIGQQWRQLFNDKKPKSHAANSVQVYSPMTSKLSDFCVVRRGTATGANSFFVMSDNEAVQNQIPSDFLLKLVRHLNRYPDVIDDQAFNMVGRDEKRWLLHVTRADRTAHEMIDQYLTMGEATEIQMRYLCRDRKSDWYDITHDLFIPDVIVSPMTRGRVHFVENKIGAAITNNLYGWRWLSETPETARSAIISWLRDDVGQTTVLAAARQQGMGLRKIEPNALAKISIPESVARSSLTLNEFWLADHKASKSATLFSRRHYSF